jgi:uncharacterized protein (TIGR01777 family)
MKVLVSGASGLAGTRLTFALTEAGHQVTRLVRDKSRLGAGASYWNPVTGEIDAAAVGACDAAINLAGESIASGRWTAKKKDQIRESRVAATTTLAKALAQAPAGSRTLINASAIGYYGNRADELLTEASPPGTGDFLSAVCRDWEAATQPAVGANVRVVLERFGVILSGTGGALKKMLLPFRLGLGGKVGSGRQYMSWVAIDDVVGATLYCLTNAALQGPVNFVTPQPVTNAEFTKTLGRVLGRLTIFPMPAVAARAAFGQMADELLLASQRVQPARLLDSGYPFKYPNLAGALEHVLRDE